MISNHIDTLYKLCRFCYQRMLSKDLSKKICGSHLLCSLVIKRAYLFYKIDFTNEISDLSKPKVVCSSCRNRLTGLESGKLSNEKWEHDRCSIEFSRNVDMPSYITRKGNPCT